MRKLLLLVVLVFAGSCNYNRDFTLETKWFRLAFDDMGQVISVYDKNMSKEYLPADQHAPLLSIRCNRIIEEPQHLKKKGRHITLSYPGKKVQAEIEVSVKKNYITFELSDITPSDSIELVIWGPYPTTIGETIGECVGVVRNNDFAIGIQALNVKTLGGYPTEESDIEPSYDIFSTGSYVDIEKDWRAKKNYRGQTARVKDFGSVIQAYTRNRNKERIIANWGHTNYVAPPFNDGGVTGSKIALFGCPPENTLELIGQIEIAEGLPHPVLDGEWAKTARSATSSYLIINFTEENLDQALELTKKAGLKYLYHLEPFKSWGHYNLDEKSFPDNRASMKRCVDRAKEQGIKLGVHTLSNFINTNDPYVTPVPDKRLARVGESVMTEDIDNNTDEIYIESPLFFSQMENNTLHAAVIDSEIISYIDVSATEPWKLTGCVRGAFGTVATAHNKGTKIGKLMDHPYKVFLSDPDLSIEIAKNIAWLFNETGLMQTSFDGLEGVWSTGMGQYARNLFTKTWYDNLDPGIKGKVINDASNPSHFNWHINTRYNWGEPWYAGFRESQTYYRLMNQDFYRRNFIPSMLGWFSMSPTTSVEDAEWLLARAAGFDAGFAFNLGFETVEKNGASDAIFKAIKTWETARMADAFTPEMKLRMEDINNEFHLEADSEGKWNLFPYKIERYIYEQKSKQDIKSVNSVIEFDNPYESQPMMFIISFIPEENDPASFVERLSLEVDNNHFDLFVDMKANQNLKLDKEGNIRLYDDTWNLVRDIKSSGNIPELKSGKNRIIFDAKFSKEGSAKLKIELKTMGKAEAIKIERSD
jgi:hypothetical protein